MSVVEWHYEFDLDGRKMESASIIGATLEKWEDRTWAAPLESLINQIDLI